MNTTALGILSAVAVLLALAFGGLHGLLVVIALLVAWRVLWGGVAAYSNAREQQRKMDPRERERKSGTQRQTMEAAVLQEQMAPQQKAGQAKRRQFESRVAWGIGLLIVLLCWWAYEHDGPDGLLVAVVLSIVTVSGSAFFYSVSDVQRRWMEARRLIAEQRQEAERRRHEEQQREADRQAEQQREARRQSEKQREAHRQQEAKRELDREAERQQREAEEKWDEEQQRVAHRRAEQQSKARRQREARRQQEARREQEREAERRQREAKQEWEEAQREQARPRQSDSWWIALGVTADASKDDIVRSYRRKIQQCHPDRVAGLAPEFIELAEKHTKDLNAAYTEAIRERTQAP